MTCHTGMVCIQRIVYFPSRFPSVQFRFVFLHLNHLVVCALFALFVYKEKYISKSASTACVNMVEFSRARILPIYAGVSMEVVVC